MLKLKTKEELLEAIRVIDKTLLQLSSKDSNTRKAHGDAFSDNLIEQIKKNKENYLEQLSHFS